MMPDQSEAPIVRKLMRTEKRKSYLATNIEIIENEYDAPINPDGPEAAEIIRLCEEALTLVRRIAEPLIQVDDVWEDATHIVTAIDRALAQIKGQNP